MSFVQVHGMLALDFSTLARTCKRRPKPALRPIGWHSSDKPRALNPSLKSSTASGRSKFQPDWLRRSVRFRRVPPRTCPA